MQDRERFNEGQRGRSQVGRESYRPYGDYDQESEYGRHEEFEGYGRGGYDQEGGSQGSFPGMERREGGYRGGRGRDWREEDQLGRGGGAFDRGQREARMMRGTDYQRGRGGFGREGRYERDYGREDFGFDTDDWERGYETRGGYDRGYEQRGFGGATTYRTSEGPFAGRGPSGYQRSDDRIREDVCERLSNHGWVDATGIEVDVKNGEVTLKGSVHDRNQKRMAEYAVDDVAGVREIHNEVRVGREGVMAGEHRDPFKPESSD